LLREAALLADNTRLIRAAAGLKEAQAAILRGFGARLIAACASVARPYL
jgi:hypothetical protein